MTRRYSTGTIIAAGTLAAALVSIAACDQRVALQPHAEAGPEPTAAPPVRPAAGEPRASREARRDGGDAPVRTIAGRPYWADNRRHTAMENAQYQFERHGAELAAGSIDEFVTRAHRFLNAPPKGSLTRVRANGDTLVFDPGSGLFGVVRQDGAPRTVFKPEDGRAYWQAQADDDRTRPRDRRASAAGRDDDRG